jgi:hypothetical protein
METKCIFAMPQSRSEAGGDTQMHVHTTLVNEQQESSVCSSYARGQTRRIQNDRSPRVVARGSSFTDGADVRAW